MIPDYHLLGCMLSLFCNDDLYDRSIRGVFSFPTVSKLVYVLYHMQKQFKPHNIQQGRQKEVPSDGPIKASPDRSSVATPDGFSTMPELHNVDQELAGEEKRQSVKERLRVPVSYEDILDDPEDGSG